MSEFLLHIFLAEKRMSVTLNASDYYKHLVEGAYIYIVAACHVPKYDSRGRTRPQQTFYKGQDFKFEKPTLEIKVSVDTNFSELMSKETLASLVCNPSNTRVRQRCYSSSFPFISVSEQRRCWQDYTDMQAHLSPSLRRYLCAQRRQISLLIRIWGFKPSSHSEDWSDWADDLADLSLCWVHRSFLSHLL